MENNIGTLVEMTVMMTRILNHTSILTLALLVSLKSFLERVNESSGHFGEKERKTERGVEEQTLRKKD